MTESMANVPIQPVEKPIICPPYDEPTVHWEYEKDTGNAFRSPGRRKAGYWYKTQRIGTADGPRLPGMSDFDEGWDDLPLINILREDVKRWREADYRGASNTTRELLHWWANPKRDRRLFYCQREAVETIIYLAEIRFAKRTSKLLFNPKLSDELLAALLHSGKPAGIELSNPDVWPTLIDRGPNPDLLPLCRLGCKMATGSGKTVVMALLISWAFCNRGVNPSSIEFPNAVLVCCPNLTVKERLQVLRPENPDNYYAAFDLVPINLRPLLQMGKVLVENWHGFAPESEHREGGKSYAVVNKGPETPETIARRVLGDLYERLPIMVLNDEGHHCWRPASIVDSTLEEPPQRRRRKRNEPDAEEKKALDEETKEARVWLEGLDQINNCLGKDTSGTATQAAVPAVYINTGQQAGIAPPLRGELQLISLMTAAFSDNCLSTSYLANDSAQQSTPVGDAPLSPTGQLSTLQSITNSQSLFSLLPVTATSLPVDPTNYFDDQLPGVYSFYKIVNDFTNHNHRVALPPCSSSGTIAVVQLAAPMVKLVSCWTAQKVGVQPEVPNPQSNDPNAVLLDSVLEQEEINPTFDGTELTYTLSGRYEYVYLDSTQVNYTNPVPPYLQSQLQIPALTQLTTDNPIFGGDSTQLDSVLATPANP